MEGKLSPELAQTPEPESSQDLDSSSQANVSEESKPDQEHADAVSVVGDAETSPKASGELKKTWGFRRTTIAKRDLAGEMAAMAASPEARGAPVRRSGRQAKRTDKLEEFLVTVKRGRGGRRSAPAQLDHDPPSETTSEASFDGNAEPKAAESKAQSPARRTRGRGRQGTSPTTGHAGSVSDDDDSSENEEEIRAETQDKSLSDGERDSVEELTHGDGEKDVELQTKDDQEEATAVKRPSRSPAKAGDKNEAKSQSGPKGGEDDEESSSSGSDNDGYDPNALYCICRQKHNKRFMICCDRCEEWFHGDCVGITEARGRLMERNGEDYVCPKCSSKKSQTAKTSASSGPEGGRQGTAAELRKADPAGAGQSATPAATAAAEDKTGEEMGIKGRIEKATNPSGKKKIKIFQPQVLVAAEGASSLPKCIGPGCERDALPESVYCGNDCILKHAAAAMKIFTTDGKEKTKPKATKKAAAKNVSKSPGPERRSSRRSTGSSSKVQEESSDSETQNDDDVEDEEDKVAEEHPPPPAMSSWSSDHNYIAVAPEKTTPISPSVLNKACMYLEGFPHFNELSHSTTCCRTDYLTHNRPEGARLLL